MDSTLDSSIDVFLVQMAEWEGLSKLNTVERSLQNERRCHSQYQSSLKVDESVEPEKYFISRQLGRCRRANRGGSAGVSSDSNRLS